MNYCKTCRRHLNGAVSCPGCGATGLELSNVQNGRSTVQMPSVSGPGRPAKTHGRLPVPDSEPYEGDLVTGAQPDAGRARHSDKPRLSVVSDADATRSASETRSAGGGRRGVSFSDEKHEKDDKDRKADAKRPRASRREEKRRGIGLMLTGGFAGIAVVVFLVYGNAGGAGSPAGNVVAAGASSTSSVSGAGLTVTVSASDVVTSARATSASASPSRSASPSPSKSSTPQQTPSSAPASASASPTPTKTTASASPTTSGTTASPTPSKTVSCWLIFCT